MATVALRRRLAPERLGRSSGIGSHGGGRCRRRGDVIVFLPGIFGSVLERDGKEVWAPRPGGIGPPGISPSASTGIDPATLVKASRVDLADSALHAPSAGFDDPDFYPDVVGKAAVLACRIAWNHPRPDGNKRARVGMSRAVRRPQRWSLGGRRRPRWTMPSMPCSRLPPATSTRCGAPHDFASATRSTLTSPAHRSRLRGSAVLERRLRGHVRDAMLVLGVAANEGATDVVPHAARRGGAVVHPPIKPERSLANHRVG